MQKPDTSENSSDGNEVPWSRISREAVHRLAEELGRLIGRYLADRDRKGKENDHDNKP